MKHLFKRTVAIVLTLCALLGLMVPAAFAETTQASEPVFYDFDLTTQLEITAGKYYHSYQTKIDGAYDELGWGIVDLTNSGLTYAQKFRIYSPEDSYGLRVYKVESPTYAAFKLHVPKAGKYNIVVNLPTVATNRSGSVIGYILSEDTAISANTLTTEAKLNSEAVSLTPEDTTITEVSLGEKTFDNADDYVLVLEYTKELRMAGITLTPPAAKVGDTEYFTVQAAVNAAAADQTVTLLRNVTEDAVTIKDGVTLDLNGKTLDANVNDAVGKVIDSSGGAGRVKGATLDEIAENQMVLTDKDGYLHICDYTLSLPTAFDAVEAAEGSVRFWFDVRFDNAAVYDVIAAGNSGFSVGANFQWNDNTPVGAKFGTDLSVEDWASKMKSDPNYSFYVNVTGLENAAANGTLTVLPTVSGKQGGGSITSGLTHTVTAAQ